MNNEKRIARRGHWHVKSKIHSFNKFRAYWNIFMQRTGGISGHFLCRHTLNCTLQVIINQAHQFIRWNSFKLRRNINL